MPARKRHIDPGFFAATVDRSLALFGGAILPWFLERYYSGKGYQLVARLLEVHDRWKPGALAALSPGGDKWRAMADGALRSCPIEISGGTSREGRNCVVLGRFYQDWKRSPAAGESAGSPDREDLMDAVEDFVGAIDAGSGLPVGSAAERRAADRGMKGSPHGEGVRRECGPAGADCEPMKWIVLYRGSFEVSWYDEGGGPEVLEDMILKTIFHEYIHYFESFFMASEQPLAVREGHRGGFRPRRITPAQAAELDRAYERGTPWAWIILGLFVAAGAVFIAVGAM